MRVRLNLQILKENGEVRKQDSLPNIDDKCNHLEVSEYIDDIYHYYWVTEVILIKFLISLTHILKFLKLFTTEDTHFVFLINFTDYRIGQ